jgi:hypothetical protein
MSSSDFLVAAIDSVGIYPKSIRNSDGTTHHRTEWEDGWNAAISSILDRWIEIERWYYTLTEKQQHAVDMLYASGYLMVQYHMTNKNIDLWINVSDTFAYACADAEEITVDDLEELQNLYIKYNWEGLVAWVAKKRNYLPLEKYQNEKFKESYNELKI